MWRQWCNGERGTHVAPLFNKFKKVDAVNYDSVDGHLKLT
jgi:hypothetical protein